MKIKRINRNYPFIYSGGIFCNNYNCREIAARNFKSKAATFSCIAVKSIFTLIRDFEKILKLPKEQRVVFSYYKDSDKNYHLSNLDKFWSQNAFRRRLLLTLIKDGFSDTPDVSTFLNRYYNKPNIVKGIKRFLRGYTVIRQKNSGGFDYIFNGPLKEKILEKP